MMKTRQRAIVEELYLETDLVYKLRNENWVRWPVFAKHNVAVMSARFFKIVEKMDELIPIRPPVNYATYQTLKRINFVKFQSHYSRIEWSRLLARLMRIFTYYEHHKEVIA